MFYGFLIFFQNKAKTKVYVDVTLPLCAAAAAEANRR
jgi:hypothetical protein